MPFQLPKHFARWVIFSAAAFLVGFIIAQLLIPSGAGAPQATVKRLIGGGQTQAQPENIIENKETAMLPIIAAVVILTGLVAYGYYREKRKRKG